MKIGRGREDRSERGTHNISDYYGYDGRAA
jgi:hypothetical protein